MIKKFQTTLNPRHTPLISVVYIHLCLSPYDILKSGSDSFATSCFQIAVCDICSDMLTSFFLGSYDILSTGMATTLPSLRGMLTMPPVISITLGFSVYNRKKRIEKLLILTWVYWWHFMGVNIKHLYRIK